ncbi:MAG: hypothetical protein U0528_08435 [Anaerolineae bacterium]
MLHELQREIPELVSALDQHPYLKNTAKLWSALQRLLVAHAPSGGSWLPGAIVDDIAALSQELGLADRFIPHLGSTGNAAIWLGAEKPVNDVIVISHMDRPSFKVRGDGSLYAICANRFPDGEYRVGAKALRYIDGKIQVSAQGTLISQRNGSSEKLSFQADSGVATWYDTITMAVQPSLKDGVILATALDNCLGVITMLGAAAALKTVEQTLIKRDRRVLLVFSDLEEGIPEAYFGHGAHKLTYAVPPPTIGCIIADAHTAAADGPKLGGGVSHGHVSAWSRGSFTPPNYLACAIDLAAEANQQHPGTVQLNSGYLSRSDDMALGRWTQILGMVGAPMIDAHTGHESGHLADVPPAIWWLAHFTAAMLGLSDSITQKYMPHTY